MNIVFHYDVCIKQQYFCLQYRLRTQIFFFCECFALIRCPPTDTEMQILACNVHNCLLPFWSLICGGLSPRSWVTFRDKLFFTVRSIQPPRPTPKLDYYCLSAVRDCSSNIFAATLHIWRLSPPSATDDAPCRVTKDPPGGICPNLYLATRSGINPFHAAHEISRISFRNIGSSGMDSFVWVQ